MYTNIGMMNRNHKRENQRSSKEVVFPKTYQIGNKPQFIECKKNIYCDHVVGSIRDTAEVEAYRQKYNIVVGGDVPAPNPIESFNEMKEIPVLPDMLKNQGHPSPMQSQAWPIILSGHDMIGLTRNGHERIFAYILPAILHIHKQSQIQPFEGPIVLLLTQSKQLGMKKLQFVDLLSSKRSIRRVFLSFEKHKIKRYLKNGLEMVIAIPEIALKLLRWKSMTLKFCSMVIVDDVDAQMAATNGEVLREILKYAPAGRQTLWFSQSWFPAAQQLAVEHMPNGHCSVAVGKFHRDVQRICSQQVHILEESECRMQYTLNLLRTIQSSSSGKVLIFTVLTEDSIGLAKYFKEEGVTVGSLNDVLNQDELQELIEEFRNGKKSCLITTDSSLQALPDGIEHVIHFSYNNSSYGMRLSHMSYSSTGGKSHVILCDTEYAAAKLMIEQLKYGNQEVTAELLKLANNEAGQVKMIQSKDGIQTTLLSDKLDTQPLDPQVQAKSEESSTKPSSSTASYNVDDKNRIPTAMNKKHEQQLNLFNIPTKQKKCNFIECRKNIYSDHVNTIVRNDTEVDAYRKNCNIKVSGNIPTPNPIESFDELKDKLLLPRRVRACGHPSPMQSQAWPIILSGHDMIGLTRNGRERTLAYILPAILHIHKQPQLQPNEGPIVLILTQSTELGMDIRLVVDMFSQLSVRRVLLSFEKPLFQKYLNRGLDMVIAMPAIVLKLLRQKSMTLKFCSMVIVDDVYALMGATNGGALRRILKYAPAGRQTLWFSHCWFAAAQQLAIEHMPSGYCNVDTRTFHSDVQRICRQKVYILKKSQNRMLHTLKLICAIQSTGKILVFTLQMCDTIKLVKFLQRGGIAAELCNGNMSLRVLQKHNIDSFRNESKYCFVSMDSNVQTLADDFEHVIHFSYNDSNYGMRLSHMSYSSTGGTSHVFLNDTEHDAAKSVIEQLKYGNQEITTKLVRLANLEADQVEKIQTKGEFQTTISELSDINTQPLEVLPQSTIEAKHEINSSKPSSSTAVNTPTNQYHSNSIECRIDIYSDHVNTIVRNDTEVDAYRKNCNIKVGGDIPAPNPIESFDELKDKLLLPRRVRVCGNPSPMQSQAWPIILSGHDMIGLTRNGRERTLAYILPAILHINKQRQLQPDEGPIVLILTQSTALGMNIRLVVDMFSSKIDIRRNLLTIERPELQKFVNRGLDMVISIPEIALNLLKQNKMTLKFCSMVIVDDVDAQMAATNEGVLREILKYAPAVRQTLWFSQSWIPAAQQLAIEHMPNGYCSVDVGNFHRDVQRICRQEVHILRQSECRMQYTLELIRKIQSSSSGKILIFTVLKDDSISLAKYLKKEGVTAGSLNDVLNHKELNQLIEEFRNCNKTCLITSDSTVQSLTDDFEHVIHFNYNSSNYGMRLSHMSYSSTGGTSHVFLNDTEHDAAKSVIEQLKYGNQEITIELERLANQEAGHVKKLQSKEDLRTTLTEIIDISDTDKLLPQSTFKAPMKMENENVAKEINNVRSKNENNSTKPSTFTASGNGEARNQIPTYINTNFENQLNLVHIPTKQYQCNFIECKKDIFSNHVAAIVRTTSEVEKYRHKNDIMVGGDILAPNPIVGFDELKDIPVLPHLLRARYHPTPMQAQAWPIILSGHDMIGLTRNGHERTFAYILPAILHINKQPKMQLHEGPIVLILTQSKSVAINILQVVDLFKIKHLRRALFTNDVHRLNQRYIRKGVDMVIALTENALTLLRLNIMNLKFCSMVIVDDVDAQMTATNGILLREILKYAPAGRQTLWFSQLWFPAAQQLAVEHMPNGYCSVEVGKFHRDVQRICRQEVHILKESECRKQYTLELIRKIQSLSSGKILIFTVLKDDSISLAKYLKQEGVTAGSLNDVVCQEDPQDLIEEFKTGKKTCLITMDSTARALPDGIEHVIHFSYNNTNYGMRLSHMSYSSTGGTSYVILCDTEYTVAQSLIEQLKYGNQDINAELLQQASYVEEEQSISHKKIEVILTTDLNRKTKKDKSVESNNEKGSNSKIEYKSTMPSTSAVAGANKRFQIAKEIEQHIPVVKKRKIEYITKSLSADKWIGANDILRRILIEDAKQKMNLSTNTAFPVHDTSSRMPINTPAACNAGNSFKGNATNSITSTTTVKRFRYEDLYGVSDDE